MGLKNILMFKSIQPYLFAGLMIIVYSHQKIEVCPSGYFRFNDLSEECLECEPGRYCDGLVSRACPTGTVQPSAGQYYCIVCPPNTHTSDAKTCEACPSSTPFSPPSSSFCNFCPANTYWNGSSCIQCPTNTESSMNFLICSIKTPIIPTFEQTVPTSARSTLSATDINSTSTELFFASFVSCTQSIGNSSNTTDCRITITDDTLYDTIYVAAVIGAMIAALITVVLCIFFCFRTRLRKFFRIRNDQVHVPNIPRNNKSDSDIAISVETPLYQNHTPSSDHNNVTSPLHPHEECKDNQV